MTDYPRETQRLSAQATAILERLKRGPATNAELATIALKYTSRISDLRAQGHPVVCVSHDHATGVCIYALRPQTGFDSIPRVIVPTPPDRLF